MEVFHLVYVSTATDPLAEDELLDIERIAIKNNAKLGVTGLLTYCDSKFMQFLEGKKVHVQEIFAKIIGDSRHHSIDVIRQGMIPKHQFIGWQMKYANINDIYESNGYIYDKLFDVKASSINILEHATESLSLLAAFKNSCPNLFIKENKNSIKLHKIH